ncbi:MAG: hypothetical protein DLM66_12585 [Candidatus Dormiibacter spiritus]|nr:MAG: hypothetical protein DLM66_12585 [Candidatus Dormibacteraeota bacterium]
MLEAVELLHELNSSGRRHVPPDAPLRFVAERWRPYVVEDDVRISRRYWELSLLAGLRGALRSGDIWWLAAAAMPTRRPT